MSSDAWWNGLAPVHIEMACGPNTHELHWSEGVLSAPAHPDADRERALMALGADPTPCLAVLDGWLRHGTDLEVLLLASRGPGDRLVVDRHQHARHGGPGRFGGSGGWTTHVPMAGVMYRPGDEREPTTYTVERLLRLDGGLPDRLVATVIAHWAQRLESVDGAADTTVRNALPRLEAALYGRLMYAIHAWRGTSKHVEVVMTEPGTPARIERSGRQLRISVPFSWLRDVWARDITTTFGRFCLSADHDGDEWSLTVVDLLDRDLGQHRLMTISLT